MTDFEAVIRALSESGVECVIVGGLAELEALVEERVRDGDP